jgi:energy-converting hydrogenase Eha subunit G
MNGNEMIALAFALTNALRLVSYAPQIWRVARDRAGAQAISCLTWNLWIAANATTALYAWTQLHDLLLAVINAGNAVCCASVVLITLAKRAGLRNASPVQSTPRLAR